MTKNTKFKKGDIFFVQDSKGETFTHSVIRRGQGLTWNSHPEIVHAGIMLDSENTVEMSGRGIVHSKLTDVQAQKVIVFRFKDQRVSDLAADLAYNMESSYLTEHYPQLKTLAEKLKYAFVKAGRSSYKNSCTMSEHQQEELENLVNDFNFKSAINNKLFCSELVVLVFAMSQLILANSNQNSETAVQCNLHFTNPSKLYTHLSQDPNWKSFEFDLIRQGNEVTFRPSPDLADLTAAFNIFKRSEKGKFTIESTVDNNNSIKSTYRFT